MTFLSSAVELLASAELPSEYSCNPEAYADWIVGTVSQACNVSAPVIRAAGEDADRPIGGLKRSLTFGAQLFVRVGDG